MPPAAASDYPIENDKITGTSYATATGTLVYDKGKKRVLGTCGGRIWALQARVVDVKKPLMSVYDMCTASQRVVFEIRDGKNCSYTEHVPSGMITPLELRNRVWELDVDVVSYANSSQVMQEDTVAENRPLCPFQGQASRL